MSDERVTTRIVYAGRRFNGAKPGHMWFREREDGDYTDAEPMMFDKVKAASIGGIFTVEQPADQPGSVYGSTLAYTGERIDDEEQRALWQATDRDVNDTVQVQAAERRHGKSPDLDAALEPLLNLARRARTRHDAAALARLASERVLAAYWRDH